MVSGRILRVISGSMAVIHAFLEESSGIDDVLIYVRTDIAVETTKLSAEWTRRCYLCSLCLLYRSVLSQETYLWRRMVRKNICYIVAFVDSFAERTVR